MTIETRTEPYDFTRGENYPGDRGIILDAERPFAPGIALSKDFPSVFISDAGDVSVDEYRWPADDMLAWLEAVAAAIRTHTSTAG